MNLKVRFSTILFLTAFLVSCSNNNEANKEVEKVVPPESATLIFPVNGEECLEGNVISSSKSRLVFDWNSSANTDRYTLVINNLISGEIIETNTLENSIGVVLDRNTPYEWYVISKSDAIEDEVYSDKWRFYNAGEGVVNYAPFPAEVQEPQMGSTATGPVTLQWLGKDVDSETLHYKIYVGTENPPKTLFGTTSIQTLELLDLEPNTVYFWKVISEDEKGFTSTSPIFEFKTE
ncbi:hypothetical protein [Cytophaga sp. FL35]|uniref:hypothetical protein n=1 Tax=Cytophaga sp. FL35 TaxID=1904456 RepID=UPI001653DFC7|nr:hypothetical protein [Cytophaga sp. FL35]MBC6999795.1 hypothetical protein [Cytophaga sp. FL35]